MKLTKPSEKTRRYTKINMLMVNMIAAVYGECSGDFTSCTGTFRSCAGSYLKC